MALGTPAAWLSGHAAPSAAAPWRSRWSSCRWWCRRRWPGSACWPRSARRGSSAARWRTPGVELVFQTAGVVVALTFVASPFYVRQALAAFGALDPALVEASRTLGAGEARTFAARRACPTRMPGLVAGGALAWGRALGEFGATLVFAGSLSGVTQTAPLAIYERSRRRLHRARSRCRRCSWPSAARSCWRVKLAGRQPGAGRCSRLRRAPGSAPLELDVAGRGGRGETPRAWPARRGPARPRCCGSPPGCCGPRRGRVRVRRAGRGWTPRRGVDLAAERRRVGYLFQDYALFPQPERVAQRGLRHRAGDSRAQRRASCARAARAVRAGRARRGPPRRACRAASASAWRWRARSRASPRRCCWTSPSRRSTRARARARARELGGAARRGRRAGAAGHARLREAALLADRVAVIDSRRGRAGRHGRTSWRRRPRSAFVADLTGAVVLTGTARPAERGLTAVELDGGGAVASTDPAEGRSPVTRAPVGDQPASRSGRTPAGSARNRLAGHRHVGDRRGQPRSGWGCWRSQPLVAELTRLAAAGGLGPGARASRGGRRGRPRPRGWSRG